jgi:hypothetical protein
MHYISRRFWKYYDDLPKNVQETAEMSQQNLSIQKTISLIEELLNRLTKESSKIENSEEYQSDVAITNFLKLLIRNVESILCLCRHDFLLLPSALIISRSTLEAAVNVLWIIAPEDPFERETRLIAFLDKELEEQDKYIQNLKKLGVDSLEVQKIENSKEQVKEYRTTIQNKIPKNNPEIKKPNNFLELLSSLNLSNLYPTYRLLSNSTHGSHAATWLYNRQMPKGFGERIDQQDWYTPLFICWWVLATIGSEFLRTFGSNPDNFLPLSFKKEIENSLDQVKSS